MHIQNWLSGRAEITGIPCGTTAKTNRARAIKKPPVFASKHENRFKRRSIAARAAQKPGFCLRKTPGFALNEPRTKPRAAKTSSLLRGIELFPCSTGGTTKRWGFPLCRNRNPTVWSESKYLWGVNPLQIRSSYGGLLLISRHPVVLFLSLGGVDKHQVKE